jgi:hypothetical protein
MQLPRPVVEQEETRQTLPTNNATRAHNPVKHTRTCNKLPYVYM